MKINHLATLVSSASSVVYLFSPPAAACSSLRLLHPPEQKKVLQRMESLTSSGNFLKVSPDIALSPRRKVAGKSKSLSNYKVIHREQNCWRQRWFANAEKSTKTCQRSGFESLQGKRWYIVTKGLSRHTKKLRSHLLFNNIFCVSRRW
jgi:hypothetical protein